MIDYSLRSCVERGVTVRRCKNCGRWFPQTGRVSAEYCERPVKYGEQRCREIGAFRQWTKKQTDDPIFKAYRKEYKKRFAWIKAGRVTDEQFYAWSEKAREEKKKCDREIISLEEFQQWLRDSNNIKLRGRQLAGRVVFVYSESKIALPLRTIQGLLSVLPLIPRFVRVLIPIRVIFPEIFGIIIVIPDASGIAAARCTRWCPSRGRVWTADGRLIISKGINDFCILTLWLMRMTVCYGLSLTVIPMQDFVPPMDIHAVIELTLFGFGG